MCWLIIRTHKAPPYLQTYHTTSYFHSFCLLTEMLWLFLLRLQLVYLDLSKEQCSVKMQRSTNLCLSTGHAVSFLAVRLIMKPIFLTWKRIYADSKYRILWNQPTMKGHNLLSTWKTSERYVVFGFCKTNTHRVHTQRTLTLLSRVILQPLVKNT